MVKCGNRVPKLLEAGVWLRNATETFAGVAASLRLTTSMRNGHPAPTVNPDLLLTVNNARLTVLAGLFFACVAAAAGSLSLFSRLGLRGRCLGLRRMSNLSAVLGLVLFRLFG